MKSDHKYTPEQLAQMFTWPHFNGFSGEQCSQCKKTANVPAGGPGWFCDEGHYNVQSWSFHQIPHEAPALGPTRQQIQDAIKASGRRVS